MRKLLVVIGLAAVLLCSCEDTSFKKYLLAINQWDSGYVYAKGDPTNENGYTFDSIQDNNIGHDPAVSRTWWSAR
jgi:hypothetical protein